MGRNGAMSLRLNHVAKCVMRQTRATWLIAKASAIDGLPTAANVRFEPTHLPKRQRASSS
jgi:hypothetical protein